MSSDEIFLRLFVYGTLKKGYRNHERFCRNAVEIKPATTWGRVYELPAGYPALEIPKKAILAHGTSDPLADDEEQAQLDASDLTIYRPFCDWDMVHGELVIFTAPLRELPPIDRLESFHPGGDCSMYQRVLVAVNSEEMTSTAWVYDGSPLKLSFFSRIINGLWKGI